MKAIFHGYYGAKNSGDDAFVEVASWGADKYWKSTNNLFLAADLPVVRTRVKNLEPHKNIFNFGKSVLKVLNSDVFVSAGGSTFHSSLKKTDLRLYAKFKKQIHLKGQTGAIGISLGPYRNVEAEKNTIQYLKTLNFLALRDTKSFEIAMSYNLPYKPVRAFDLAALLPDVYNNDIFNSNKGRGEEKIIGVSICNYESYTDGDLTKETRRNDYVLNILNLLKDNPKIKFRFFIFNGNPIVGDEKLTHKVISNLNSSGRLNFEVIHYLENVEKTMNRISECDIMFSTRLHASIFAAYSDTPFFLVEYHRKCSDFLNDIGQNNKYRIYDGDVSPDSVVSEIQSILFRNEYLKPSNLIETRKRALLNFTETYR